MPITTSDALCRLLGTDLLNLLDDAESLMSTIWCKYPQLSIPPNQTLHHRAAFAIPHLCTELAYYSLAGYFMPRELRRSTMHYGLICLATGLGDDLIDAPPSGFLKRVTLANISVVLGHTAYTALIRHAQDAAITPILAAIDEMITRLTISVSKEIAYRDRSEFDLSQYLALAAEKTSTYTVPAFLLGAALLPVTSERDRQALRQIGINVGTAFQLLDDVLDASTDSSVGRVVPSYPTYLMRNGRSLLPVMDLILIELENALSCADALPYPRHIQSLLLSTQRYLPSAFSCS